MEMTEPRLGLSDSERGAIEQRVGSLPARDCPASMEAVYEHGDVGCPICGRDMFDHVLEVDREVLREAS